MRPFAGFLVLFLIIAAALPARAQEAEDKSGARLNAFACGTLPQPLRLDVQVMDNNERHLRYRSGLVSRLTRAGIEVSENAPAILMLEVRKVVEFDRREGGELFELRAGQEDEDIGREGDLYMRGNVWSNRSDSVLGGRKRDPGQLSTEQLQVTASVNRRDDGRCLWRGEVRYDLDGDDEDKAVERVMPVLAGALGKTVRNRPVTTVQ